MKLEQLPMGLFCLEKKKGMKEVYKILHAVEMVDKEKFFFPSHNNTRIARHLMKLNGRKIKSDQKK